MPHLRISILISIQLFAVFTLHAQADCNAAYRPVVLVHGFLASGDTWSHFSHGFRAMGYCPDRLVAHDWNTLNQQVNHTAALDAHINRVLARTGAKQVDLIGHSAGGGLGYKYLSDSTRAAKVAHYVHLGSLHHPHPAGPDGRVPTLNLWSDGDRVVPGKDIPGAINVPLSGLDHYQVATSTESFLAVFLFLNENQLPKVAEWTPHERVRIGGRVLFFGENKPAAGAAVALYYLDPRTGQHTGAAAATTRADEQGNWAIQDVQGNIPVELVVQTGDDSRPVHYFREGFVQPHDLVYLRVLPGPGTLVSLLLAGLPDSPKQTVLNIFASGQAVVSGRDSLFVNGIPIATEQHAAPEKTAISFFLYDGNDNQQSDLSAVGMFGKFPFLSGVDFFLNPEDNTPVEVRLNEKRQIIRKIRSSEGLQVLVFE